MALILALAPPSLAQNAREIVTVETPVRITRVVLCPDGRQAAGIGAGKVYLWNIATPGPVRNLALDAVSAVSLACANDGKSMAIGTRPGEVLVVDRPSETVRRRLSVAHSPIGDLKFSPDSTLLGIAPANVPAELWDISAGKRLSVLKTEFGGSQALAFSPDSKVLASADEDTTVRFYDSGGRLRSSVTDLLLESFSADFTPDGKQLVVSGADRKLSFIDSATGRIVRQLGPQPDPIFYMVMSPDGNVIVTFHLDADTLRKQSTWVWDAPSGVARPASFGAARIIGEGSTGDRRLVLFTTDGGQKVTAWSVP